MDVVNSSLYNLLSYLGSVFLPSPQPVSPAPIVNQVPPKQVIKPSKIQIKKKESGIIFTLDGNKSGNLIQYWNGSNFDLYTYDYIEFFKHVKLAFPNLIQEIRKTIATFQIQCVIKVTFVKKIEGLISDSTQYFYKFFASNKHVILHTTDNLGEVIDNIVNQLIEMIINFQENGSGWRFEQITSVKFINTIYNPTHGSSYIKIPKVLLGRAIHGGLINIQNNDQYCFEYNFLQHFYPNPDIHYPKHPKRLNYWRNLRETQKEFDFSMFKQPGDLAGMSKCEKVNNVSIYIFNCETSDPENIYPIYPRDFRKHYNETIKDPTRKLVFLRLETPMKAHYVLIKHFEKFMRAAWGSTQGQFHMCYACCYHTVDKNVFDKHIESCYQHDGQLTKYPEVVNGIKPIHQLHNMKEKMIRSPITFICDFEADPLVVNLAKGTNTNLDTQHIMSSFGLNIVSPTIPQIEEYVDRTYDANSTISLEQQFLDLLHDKIKSIVNYCENKNITVPSIINCFFHNFKGYDSNFIFHGLADHLKKFKNPDIDLIQNSSEKIMTMSIYYHLNDITVCLKFKDSLLFMKESLDKLSNNLSGLSDTNNKPDLTYFKYLKKYFTEEQAILLSRKGIYPYDYFTSPSKYDETSLPPKSAFHNTLTGEDIKDEQYKYAQLVWEKTVCKTLRDYQRVYMKTDILLLSDVLERFRDISISIYKLDPVNYVSLPGFAFDSMFLLVNDDLKKLGGLELISDPNMYLTIENAIRGGISMISNRYAKANNKYMKNYDLSIESNYIKYLDANNLYGWAMSQKLPTNGYRWASEDEIKNFDINKFDDDKMGCILTIDAHTPAHLHDYFNDYPLLCESLEIDDTELSAYTTSLLGKLNKKNIKTRKLVPHLGEVKSYAIHYKKLQQAIKLGLVVTKIHSIIFYNHAAWMKPYIDLNTSLRAKATNSFEKDFFKLMNNAPYGKTLENVRNHTEHKLLRLNHPDDAQKQRKYQNRATLKFLPEPIGGMLPFNFNKKCVLLDRPIILGFCILELSKYLMIDFYYNYLKPKYGDNVRLLMTDTDSFILDIKTDDWYRDVLSDSDLYDFSDYDKAHMLFSDKNKKVIGKMKDEYHGKHEIVEFVGLRPKSYALRTDNEKDKIVSKGIDKKSSIKSDATKMTFDDYKKVLEDEITVGVSFKSIRSVDHKNHTMTMSKTGLSGDDNKRYQMDKYSSLAYGHCRIKN